MRYAHAGQDEEAAVIGKQRESLNLEGRRPPDPPISNTALERCTRPSQQGKPTVLVKRRIAQRLTYHPLEPEIVMPSHQPIPERLLGGTHRTYFNALDHFPDIRRQWMSIMFHNPFIGHSEPDVQEKSFILPISLR